MQHNFVFFQQTESKLGIALVFKTLLRLPEKSSINPKLILLPVAHNGQFPEVRTKFSNKNEFFAHRTFRECAFLRENSIEVYGLKVQTFFLAEFTDICTFKSTKLFHNWKEMFVMCSSGMAECLAIIVEIRNRLGLRHLNL